MDTVLWILLCFFASVGLVQCVGWLLYSSLRPQGSSQGYFIAPLTTEPAGLEAQIRYYMLRRSWGGITGAVILVPQKELSAEGKAICDRMLRGKAGVLLCYPWELSQTLPLFEGRQDTLRHT